MPARLRRALLALAVCAVLGVHASPAASPARYRRLPLFELFATADCVVAGEITWLTEDDFDLWVEIAIAGDPAPERLSVSRFVDWTCARRWTEYAVGQRVVLFLRSTGDAYRILGGGGEGEMPLSEEAVVVRGYTVPGLEARERKVLGGSSLGPLIPLQDFADAVRGFRDAFAWGRDARGRLERLDFKSEARAIRLRDSSPLGSHLYGAVVASDAWAHERPAETRRSLPGQGAEPARAIAAFDRTRGGTLYGTSSQALYRSGDSGQSWDKLAEQHHLGAVFAFEDGSGAVVATEAGLSTWTEERPVLVPVLARGESEKRVAEQFFGSPPPPAVQARKGKLWIATSYDTDGDPGAERMLRSSDTVRRGSHFTALVYASADDGRSWKEVDRYVGAIVHALWLGSDDVVSMCMSDGVIRSGKLDVGTGEPGPEGFRDLPSSAQGLGGQWASWLAFPSPSEGAVGGNIYFGGSVLHRTHDGGCTWQASELAEANGVVEPYRLGGGACVRIVGFWREHSRVEAWREGAFQELRVLEEGVQDALVDATGCLLVRLKRGEVWSLSADAQAWTQVGSIQLPPK